MGMASTLRTRFTLVGVVVAGLVGLVACTTDDNDPGAETDGSGGTTSTNSESGGSGGSGGGATSTGKCAVAIPLNSSAPGIATFDDYDGSADLSTWSFPLGGDAARGVFAGPFGYGDETTGQPEAFAMVDGNDSTYALSISDSDSQEYGGGMGIWISDCIDASAFSGISFWVRGNAPTGEAKLSILMGPTTPEVDDGTCTGTMDTCIQPSYTFPVSEEWTEVQVPWNEFSPGQTPDAVVEPDGSDIWQIQYDIGLVWEEGDSGEYVPVPGAYELVVDDLTFY